MATGIALADRNSALDTIYTGTQYIKLHTGDPGSAGTANAAANTTRQGITWNAASAGTKTSAVDASWASVSTTETYTHYSVWTASSGGTFKGSGTINAGTGAPVTAGQTFTISAGQLSMAISGAA